MSYNILLEEKLIDKVLTISRYFEVQEISSVQISGAILLNFDK